ncbi:MAG: iron-containing alcohol dehydrogenase [Chloroflexi bacterium]|nr:iron-containing alcohol dehydrogenase [Chloroflexota bacterium]
MWYFVSPEVVYGRDAVTRLAQLEGKSAFIVTDANMVKLGFVDKVKEQLSKAGIKSTVFDGVEPDPSIETVNKGASEISRYGPDWIVALGGGSVMDAAKGMSAGYERPDVKVEEINPFTPLGPRKKAKLIGIPTTSGTGAEATWGMVLTVTAEQRKGSFGCRECTPDIAIVDPAFALAMPPDLTAQTGLDTLTHAVEGFTSTWKNDFSDGLLLRAIQLVFQYLPRAYKDGHDMEAREKLHNAACIAGMGFINSMCALAHATGHALGGVFHTPHGRAVGLFLPYTIEFIGDAREELWAEIAYSIKLEVPKGKKAAPILAQAIRELARSVKEPLSIKETGIPSDSFNNCIEKLVDNAMMDFQLVTTARPPNSEETEKFFRYAYDGKSIDF